jgi:hypothetical protein
MSASTIKTILLLNHLEVVGDLDLLRNLLSLGPMVYYSQFCAATAGCKGAPRFKSTYLNVMPLIIKVLDDYHIPR